MHHISYYCIIPVCLGGGDYALVVAYIPAGAKAVEMNYMGNILRKTINCRKVEWNKIK